jgi:hypothetical protein
MHGPLAIRMVSCQSRYTHPGALPGFRTPELGRQFREAAYVRHGIKMPRQAPQTITVLTNVGAEQVRRSVLVKKTALPDPLQRPSVPVACTTSTTSLNT